METAPARDVALDSNPLIDAPVLHMKRRKFRPDEIKQKSFKNLFWSSESFSQFQYTLVVYLIRVAPRCLSCITWSAAQLSFYQRWDTQARPCHSILTSLLGSADPGQAALHPFR